MDKLYRFISGRYGNDQLSCAMLIVALLFNLFFRFTAFGIFGLLGMALTGLVVYRMLSRNVPKRREENRRFVCLWTDAKRSFNDWKIRKAQSKEFKFYSCPDCKNMLRVPRGKGKIHITCPKCGQRFGGKT